MSAWLVALGWTLATLATCMGIVAGLFSANLALVVYTIGLSSALVGQSMLERDRLRDAIDLRRRLVQRRRRRRGGEVRPHGSDSSATESLPPVAGLRTDESASSLVPSEPDAKGWGGWQGGFQESSPPGSAQVDIGSAEPAFQGLMVPGIFEALEGAESSAWVWDLSTGVLLISERWSRSLGYDPTEIEPRIEAWTRLLHPEDHAHLIAGVERHLRGMNGSLEFELRAMSRSGGWQRFELRARVSQRSETGEPLRMSGLLFAIPESMMDGDGGQVASILRDAHRLSSAVTECFEVSSSISGRSEETSDDAVLPQADFGGEAFSLNGIRVLVAEDGPEHQRVLRWQLERLGCQVMIVEEGQSAVARLVATPHDFDVLLLDMQMPVMDGYTTARRLRDVGFELPIVALTSYLADSERLRCREAGCDAWLEKPVHRERLRNCLMTLLQKVSLRKDSPSLLGS